MSLKDVWKEITARDLKQGEGAMVSFDQMQTPRGVMLRDGGMRDAGYEDARRFQLQNLLELDYNFGVSDRVNIVESLSFSEVQKVLSRYVTTKSKSRNKNFKPKLDAIFDGIIKFGSGEEG